MEDRMKQQSEVMNLADVERSVITRKAAVRQDIIDGEYYQCRVAILRVMIFGLQ